jgi:hypothetical protein
MKGVARGREYGCDEGDTSGTEHEARAAIVRELVIPVK